MKNNNQGFTLVELLAVIVVLAIIMIIAVPNVLNSLEKAKVNAFKVYAQEVLMKATEFKQVSELQSNESKSCYTISEIKMETANKYQGVVMFDTDINQFRVYLTDGEYIANGLNSNDLTDVDNIVKGNVDNLTKSTCS